MLGHVWNDRLEAVAKKCSRSVLRGLAGSTRSMDFDLRALATKLPVGRHSLDESGPLHPRAMFITAALFMLRELEASAIDLEDITQEEGKVTLHLPVSKTDWQAKGCYRSWSCVCGSELPCVVHILEDHCKDLARLYSERDHCQSSRPLFPTASLGYCTKQGVVNSLRTAIESAGGTTQKGDGTWVYSGHAFRITGARTLARHGLDCITIQLLGRWGSNAVLSYLAESPLDGFSERLKGGLANSKLRDVVESEPPAFSHKAQQVFALDMIEEMKGSHREIQKLEEQIAKLTHRTEDHAQALEGLEHVLEESTSTELWSVDNEQSKVRHKAVVDLNMPPATWRTLCGWNFSTKDHAMTARSIKHDPKWRPCPKCFPSDASDSSTSSSSED